jgi:hypothetical protein
VFTIIFTSDYEIHGNGEGSPVKLMVEPTERMMDLFNKYDAKLTIMADAAEIIKYKEYFAKTGSDEFNYKEIEKQLKKAIKTGHDVQLHLHPSFFKSNYKDGAWHQYYEEYDLAGIGYKRLDKIIGICKNYLVNILKPIDAKYECNVFRAANWSMQPSGSIIQALLNNNITIDTSVFKNGIHKGLVTFDYKDAYSNLFPWPVSNNEICIRDIRGKLIEIPIYSEMRFIFSFFSINRIYRALQTIIHRSGKNILIPSTKINKKVSGSSNRFRKLKRISTLFKKYPWKLDFNQCTGRQLVRSLKRIERNYLYPELDLPIVLIGHSKLFNKSNQKSLKYFLKFVTANKNCFRFGKFSDINVEKIIKFLSK